MMAATGAMDVGGNGSAASVVEADEPVSAALNESVDAISNLRLAGTEAEGAADGSANATGGVANRLP